MDDHDLALRRGIIAHLKADAAVAALVGQKVYEAPLANQEWPFIRYGYPIVAPVRAHGWKVSSFDLTIHAFAKGPSTDQISALKTAIHNSLDEAEIVLNAAGGLALLQRGSHFLVNDTDELSAYHAVIGFEAITTEIAEDIEIVSDEYAVPWLATSQTLLEANSRRKGIVVYNTSNFDAFIREGDAPPATTALGGYNYIVRPRERWDMPAPIYTGKLTVIFAGAAGTNGLNVTERTG